MRAALICLPDAGEVPAPLVAGRSAAACQLELAIKCGCELVVVHGHGASHEAIALRHRTEQAGARFQTVNDVRALIGAVGVTDSLLVLQAGLWPESKHAIEALRSPAAIVVVPAGAGLQAGFERINLDRAWAGALVLPGHLLASLAALPEDTAPAPALLRVALQNGLPEIRIGAELLDDGSWTLLRSSETTERFERIWLRRVVGEGRGSGISVRVARGVLHAYGGKLAGHPRAFMAALGALCLALAGALALAWNGHPAPAFALLALAAPVAELAAGLAQIRAAPFGSARHWPRLRHLLDIGLVACSVWAIEGLWQRAVFAPFVLVAGLLLLDRRILPSAAEAVRDRGVVAAVLAVLVLALRPEPAIMLVAALVLGANLWPDKRN